MIPGCSRFRLSLHFKCHDNAARGLALGLLNLNISHSPFRGCNNYIIFINLGIDTVFLARMLLRKCQVTLISCGYADFKLS